ncbi:MAG: hypothetical protein MI919_11910, partial [Holophagales bacterium]|nr:hypothetical protein [Holophagales bacterium]
VDLDGLMLGVLVLGNRFVERRARDFSPSAARASGLAVGNDQRAQKTEQHAEVAALYQVAARGPGARRRALPAGHRRAEGSGGPGVTGIRP